ncbi:MAG: hypothetical protein KF905_08040 [Flavobacteriales bacterium]|nr:hypothetical protein [Flavobacteriales bacterium]
MRKTLTFTIALAASGLMAQNVNVVNAYNHMKAGELAKASEFIEMATQDPKTGISEKTWRYRGEIYYQMVIGEDAAMKQQFPDANARAIESYMKANQYDTKGSYKRDNDRILRVLQGMALNNGNEAFTNKEYDRAIALYAESERVATNFGEADTNAIFNSALAYDYKGDDANAIRRYREAIAAGYKGPEVYRYIASVQRRGKDNAGAITTLQQGREGYPNDKELVMDLMSLLLMEDRSDEAESMVKVALEKDGENAVLWSVLGSLYDKKATAAAEAGDEASMLKWYGMAEEAYKTSIAKDKLFFDSYFNVGVLYNNRAAYDYEKCNKIKSDTEYLKCKKVADDIYLKALPYFEEAHALREDDVPTIQQLMKLYAKMSEQAKYDAIKAKLPKQ